MYLSIRPSCCFTSCLPPARSWSLQSWALPTNKTLPWPIPAFEGKAQLLVTSSSPLPQQAPLFLPGTMLLAVFVAPPKHITLLPVEDQNRGFPGNALGWPKIYSSATRSPKTTTRLPANAKENPGIFDQHYAPFLCCLWVKIQSTAPFGSGQ